MKEITWTFPNLEALADHLENRAREQRASLRDAKALSPKTIEGRARAAEQESLAYLLRHCEIRGGDR